MPLSTRHTSSCLLSFEPKSALADEGKRHQVARKAGDRFKIRRDVDGTVVVRSVASSSDRKE
jgi:hypothetical protein